MGTTYLGIEKIVQKDNYSFLIKWTDGLCQEFRLCTLQRNCTCIRCYDREKNISLITPTDIQDDIRAFRIYPVGRYALKIDFEKGCSKGIYTFQYLRQLAYENN